jgi:hypothetical protein
LTIFVKVFTPTTACIKKLLREWSEVLYHVLQVDISRIDARLAEKVKIGDELEDLVEACN